MKRKEFRLKKSNYSDWYEVFKNSGPITFKSFVTGHVIINKKGTLNPEHPHAGEIKDELLKVPIVAHWIHHTKYGDYLVDAGLDSSYDGDPYGKMKGIFAGLFKKLNLFGDRYFQEKNHDILFHLKKNKINLKGVFLSHLHSDHIAGVRDLPKNVQYVVGKGERYARFNPFFYGDYLKGVKVLYEIDFSKAFKMPILGPCADIFGDGSFWALPTPGHTSGHISFLINGTRPVLLTMDACFIKLGFEKGIGSSDYTDDVLMAQSSLNNLVEFKRIYPNVKVLCGHEI